MLMLWALAVAWLALCRGEPPADTDSLRGALEAINRRQRDLADPALYYLEHFHPPREIMYPRRGEGDGQPEDIGYGYQKSLAPKTAGIFEAIPLPERELGSHDPGVQPHYPDEKSFENVILDYIEDNMGNPVGVEPNKYHYQTQNSAMKRSVFRERDVNELPSALQNLYSEGENSDQYYENGEHPQVMPSSFRERLSSKILRNNPVRNAHSLVRNFGGLNRDSENAPDSDDDPDEYLSMLNSIWEKYQFNNPENVDPEDLNEGDVQEILDYINHKEEKKRQYDDSYENGYDFFNSPLAWVKRDKQRHNSNLKHPNDQILHTLKFISSHKDTTEPLHEEEVPDDERDADIARLLLDQQVSKHYKQHKKRFWRGNSYEDHHKNSKRYPIAKRSPSFYTSPAVLYHTASSEKFNQRRKKNVKSNSLDSVTDPKVAKELNNIFSPSGEIAKETSNNTETKHNSKIDSSPSSNTTKAVNESEAKNSVKEGLHDHEAGIHIQRKRSGQKEETSVDSQHKPLVLSKKSVDWSNYFGIDKRRKKSTIKPGNDEWLLDQYLKAYLISARAVKDPTESSNEISETRTDQDKTDDMDNKLQAMEDMIVDQALKYTGAHEGVTDPEEVHTVSYRVMAQLLAAFSLEKMREALREFKSSIAAQKASSPAHTTTYAPTEVPDQKDKRVAIKKEKAEIPPDMKLEKKEDTENAISALHSGHSRPGSLIQEDSCSVAQRCKEIANIVGDSLQTLTPFCTLHQVCYLCGSQLAIAPNDCDMTFLSDANNFCGDREWCRYLVRRTFDAMNFLRGDPYPLGCDWQNHPCPAAM